MKNRKKARGPYQIQTAAEIADLLQVDRSTVTRWMQRDDWAFGQGPWTAETLRKIAEWRAVHLKETAAAAADPRTRQLRTDKLSNEGRKLLAQAEAAELELAKMRGELLSAQEVEEEWARLGVMVRNGFENLPSQLVPLALSHGMPSEAAGIFTEQAGELIADILRRLSRDGEDQPNRESQPV